MTFYNRPRNTRRNPWPFLAFVAGAVLILGFIGLVVYPKTQVQTVTCTVASKDRVKNTDGRSEARIYTEDCGVLTANDSLIDGHFDSADTYGYITAGHRYDFKTRGVRVPFLSMFPNIVEADEVK